MPNVKIESKEITNANILKVSVGTNAPKGGDTGHGGRTYLKLSDEASTDIRVKVNNSYYDEVDSVEIVLGGDTEAETFIESLRFAVETLKRQYESNNNKHKYSESTIDLT